MKRIALAFAVATIAFTIGTVARAHAGEPARLLVLDVPNDFASVAAGLGFAGVEAVKLEILQVSGFRLVVPAGQTTTSAVNAIKNRFPSALVDIDDSAKVLALVR